MIKEPKPLNNQTELSNGDGATTWHVLKTANGLRLADTSAADSFRQTASGVPKGRNPPFGPDPADGAPARLLIARRDSVDPVSLAKAREAPALTVADLPPAPPLALKNLPFYSRWFEWAKVSRIERESLPEFFQEKASKTPQIYLRMRNFMVALYWTNPKLYLTASACRKAIRGDACAVLRVHAFLEHWSLINGCYKPSTAGTNTYLKEQFVYPTLVREDFPQTSKQRPQVQNQRQVVSVQKNQNSNSKINEETEKIKEDELKRKEPAIWDMLEAQTDKLDSSMENGASTKSGTGFECFGSAAFQTIVLDRIFEELRVKRPKCSRCSKLIGKEWYAKPFELEVAIKPHGNKFYMICQPCFESNNFPIFFAKESFYKASIEQLSPEEFSSAWSINERIDLFEILKNSSGVDSCLRNLRNKFSSKNQISLLLVLLKSPQDLAIQQEQPAEIRNNCFTFANPFEKAYEKHLKGFLEFFKHEEKKSETIPAEQELMSDPLRQSIEKILDKQIDNIGKRLSFLGEVEKILNHEKLNLQMIR